MATELEKSLTNPVMSGDVATVSAILEDGNVSKLQLSHEIVAIGATVELLELLTAHGYDINRPGSNMPSQQGRTLIDYKQVLAKENIVHWLVEHGAELNRGQEDYLMFACPPPLLETAAQWASVPTFKYLKEKGAKLGRRTLHLAVEMAASRKSDPEATPDWKGFDMTKPGANIRLRMREMLPYLVDELKLDINADDFVFEDKCGMKKQEISRPPGHYGTPLCYAVGDSSGIKVVEWLLRKGADPKWVGDDDISVRAMAKARTGTEKVLDVLNAWETQHGLTETDAKS